MNRRRFLKYAGAAAAAVGASALGLDYFWQSRPPTSNQTTTTSVSTSRFNFPPIAKFDLSPKYLNPTDQQTIQFTNLSTDADSDYLTYEWLIDNQSVSVQKGFSTRLPVGTHLVQLDVSDGTTRNTATNPVTVEPDQIYPMKSLHINLKGMRYSVGNNGKSAQWFPPEQEVDEELSTIHDELGCNAVTIVAGLNFHDKLVPAAESALQKQFDRIYLLPNCQEATLDEATVKIESIVRKIRPLREKSEKIVLMAGHEFVLDLYGMIPGETWFDRLRYQTTHPGWKGAVNVSGKVRQIFSRIIPVVKENYGYPISYSAAVWEVPYVPWEDPIFESIGTNAYLMDAVGWNEEWALNHLSSLRRFSKPINSTEWGCESFKGADDITGISPLYEEQNPYDEDVQAQYASRYFDMLNRARINGAFWTQYNVRTRVGVIAKSYGLINGMNRKKGFYMYKSYQRVS